MAQRRMFSKQITDSDSFLSMSLSAQALYFHLGMQADDDGFVPIVRISKMLGTSIDDQAQLFGRGFLLHVDLGVIVIRDWKVNNEIKADRYTPTMFQVEKSKLKINAQKQYKMNMDTKCLQIGDIMDTQVRLGKDRIEILPAKPEENLKDFSLDEEIRKLEESDRRDLNIIALYLDIRKPDLKSKEQFQVAIRRHLRPAKILSPFTDDQILKGVEKAKKQTSEWTIETVGKMLTK